MRGLLGKVSGKLYALVRIFAGFMFLQHGAQKLFGVLGAEGAVPLASKMGAAGVIEFGGGLLILLGVFTSWAAFLASGTMAVAYFQVHWKFQLGREFFPAINQGELAVVYCFLFLFIASRGSGPWSFELRRRKD